jgi:hypothetical protein
MSAMAPLLQRVLRPLLIGGGALLLAALPALRAGPVAAQAAPGVIRPGSIAPAHQAAPQSGSQFLYADDGLNFGNSISGFHITRFGLVPTPGSPYPTGGNQGTGRDRLNCALAASLPSEASPEGIGALEG